MSTNSETTKKNPKFTTLLDVKTQKCGLRCTVFSPSGNEYTGEWLDNKKHGEIPWSVSFLYASVKLIYIIVSWRSLDLCLLITEVIFDTNIFFLFRFGVFKACITVIFYFEL